MKASRDPNMHVSRYVNSPFITTFVLHSFNYLKTTPPIKKMKKKAISFLIEDMESPCIWRFFGKYSSILADIDDTSCALAVLAESGIHVDRDVLSFLLNLRLENGSFYTWFLERYSFQGFPYSDLLNLKDHVDWTVNANVLYLYSILGSAPPEGLCEYLNSIVNSGSYFKESVFYCSSYAFTYMLTRAYADGGASCVNASFPQLGQYLLNTQKQDGSWGNELETALATVSLLNIGYEGKELDSAINRILDMQQQNGGWPISVFCTGRPLSLPYFGSEELTTGICLEALGKYLLL